MRKALPFILFVFLALVMGGLFAWSLLRPPGDSYVTVTRLQAVAPEYQVKPLRVDCPQGSKIFVPICYEAGKFVESGGQVASTRKRCMPGSVSYRVSGRIKDRSFEARFDCNSTNQEALRSAAEELLAK